MPRDLIIVRAGTRSLHRSWVEPGQSRSWDLLICPYEEISAHDPSVDGLFVSDVIAASAKFSGLKVLLNEWSGWRDYRYVMLADDDVAASQETWSRFFEKCALYDAKLAQPSLTEDPPASHWVTIKNSEFVARRVSYVEGMLPTFRVDILSDLLGTLDLTYTGWGYGLEFLWGKRLDYKDMFVIDETTVVHTRLPGANRSPELKKQLPEEIDKIMRENNLTWLVKTFSGIDKSGSELREVDPAFLYRLYCGYKALFKKYPWRVEEIFRLQLMATPGR